MIFLLFIFHAVHKFLGLFIIIAQVILRQDTKIYDIVPITDKVG